MTRLEDWLTWTLSPSLSAILVTLIFSLTLPILIHTYLYKRAVAKELPTFLLLGPSGAGKTSLLTLVRRPNTTYFSPPKTILIPNNSCPTAHPPQPTRPKPPKPPLANSPPQPAHPKTNTAPKTTPPPAPNPASYSSTHPATANSATTQSPRSLPPPRSKACSSSSTARYSAPRPV